MATSSSSEVQRWVSESESAHADLCQLISGRQLDAHRDLQLLMEMAQCQCQCGNSAIHVASVNGDLAVVSFLTNFVDVNCANERGETALHLACSVGHLEMVYYLLTFGADPNMRDNAGIVPLHIALVKCDVDTADCLLRYGADSDQLLHETARVTPLHLAIRKGYQSMAKLLIDFGVDINARDEAGRSATYLAVEHDDRSTLAHLLGHKVFLEEEHRDGQTVLHLACATGKETCAKMLLEAGANPNARDDLHVTPMHLVAESSNLNLVHLLLRHGSDINCVDAYSRSPLHIAAQSNQPEMVDYLVTCGADVDEEVLLEAVSRGLVDVVKKLLLQGSSIETRSRDGKTLLGLAVECEDEAMVEYLMSQGADPAAMSWTFCEQ